MISRAKAAGNLRKRKIARPVRIWALTLWATCVIWHAGGWSDLIDRSPQDFVFQAERYSQDFDPGPGSRLLSIEAAYRKLIR